MRVLRSQYFIPFLVTKVLALRMRTPLSGIFWLNGHPQFDFFEAWTVLQGWTKVCKAVSRAHTMNKNYQ